MTLAERIVALHRALSEASIAHAFGGAIALAYWTRDPRGTSDIDVNVFVPAADCLPALEALPQDVSIPPGTAEIISAEGQVRLWWDDAPLDLFFDYVPVHGDAARHARRVPFAGTHIPVLAPVELAIFKIMFDRTRDWADVEDMLAAQTLDTGAVRAGLSALLPDDDDRFRRLDETVERVRHRG